MAGDEVSSEEAGRSPEIVYLIDQPLDARNYERFGIQAWRDRGWTVEVWDFTPLAFPQIWREFIDAGHELSAFAGYVPIHDETELTSACDRARAVAYYIDLADSGPALRTKGCLSNAGAKHVVCFTGSIPEAGRTTAARMALKVRRVLATGLVGIVKWLSRRLRRHVAVRPFATPDVVVVSGARSRRAATAAWPAATILEAHNLDFDLYLALPPRTDAAASEYIVFLDDDLCFHSDFVALNRPAPATPERYFPTIERGLRSIGRVLALEVRVAAHPRTAPGRGSAELFRGLPVEHGKTVELVRGCRAVVCHYSTAAQLAVLLGKPLIFVTTDELERSPAGAHIAGFAAALDRNVINLDRRLDRVDWSAQLRVDRDRYACYRNEYIKIDGSPVAPFWEILISHVESELGPARARQAGSSAR